MSDLVATYKYDIFIGLKDKDSYEEYFTIKQFTELLEEYCKDKQIAFSLISQFGGYTHNKGYTTETSLKIEMIGADYEIVKELGLALKKMVNTDTIMITREKSNFEFL